MNIFAPFVRISMFILLFSGPFSAAASDTVSDADAPTDCCLPVVDDEETPSLEAKIHLEPGESGGLFPFPPESRPTKRSGQSIDISDRTWNEEEYDRRDRWTLEDTLYQAQYVLLHVIDWGQTRYVAESDEFYEMNPILGSNPKKDVVDLYFSITLIGHTAVSLMLPEKWRRKWQFFWIGLESFVTANNSAAGVAISF